MGPSSRLASAGLLAVSLLAGTALCSSAQATPVSFSFNFTYGGGTTQTYSPGSPGTLLSDATTVTEGAGQTILSVTSVFGPPAGAVGDPITYVAAPLSVPIGPSGPLVNGLIVKWDTYSFTSAYGSYSRVPAQDALTFTWAGTFTDSTGALNTQGATLSQTWSQASPGIQPSTGGTVNTNPDIPLPVPEPGAMWLLATGLLGLAVTRRRRASRLRPTRRIMA